MKQSIMSTQHIACSFSGYRPEKLPWGIRENDPRCKELKAQIKDILSRLYDSGIRHYICGMARGSDTYFCEAVLMLRASRPEITLEAAIPCETQTAKWIESDRCRYYRLVQQCDFETFVSRKYTRDCMIKRNRYMVDNSSVLVTVFDGKFGGTMHTIEYAVRKGLHVIELAP